MLDELDPGEEAAIRTTFDAEPARICDLGCDQFLSDCREVVIDQLPVNAEAGRQFVTFVSTKAWFAGHEIDADPWRENPASWIHELSDISTLSEPYHPTAEGHRQIAAAVMASAGPAGDFGVSR